MLSSVGHVGNHDVNCLPPSFLQLHCLWIQQCSCNRKKTLTLLIIIIVCHNNNEKITPKAMWVGGCQYEWIHHSCIYIFVFSNRFSCLCTYTTYRNNNDVEYKDRVGATFILHLPYASYPSLLPYQASVGSLSDSDPFDHSWFMHSRGIERNETKRSKMIRK